MTTCDFWATRVDAPGPAIEFGNGLGGPATAAFLRLRDLVLEGRIVGIADEASASGRLSGQQLREMLTGLGDNDGPRPVTRLGHHDETSLMAAIDDEGIYSASAIDF